MNRHTQTNPMNLDIPKDEHLPVISDGYASGYTDGDGVGDGVFWGNTEGNGCGDGDKEFDDDNDNEYDSNNYFGDGHSPDEIVPLTSSNPDQWICWDTEQSLTS